MCGCNLFKYRSALNYMWCEPHGCYLSVWVIRICLRRCLLNLKIMLFVICRSCVWGIPHGDGQPSVAIHTFLGVSPWLSDCGHKGRDLCRFPSVSTYTTFETRHGRAGVGGRPWSRASEVIPGFLVPLACLGPPASFVLTCLPSPTFSLSLLYPLLLLRPLFPHYSLLCLFVA